MGSNDRGQYLPAYKEEQWHALVNANFSRVADLGINVKGPPYNAVGDGVTDDTAAIQTALDAAGDAPVVIPQGTFVSTWPRTIAAGKKAVLLLYGQFNTEPSFSLGANATVTVFSFGHGKTGDTLALEVLSDTGNGLKQRFVIENNPTEPMDLDFRNVVVHLGTSTQAGVALEFRANAFYAPVTVRRPGSDTIVAFQLNSSGGIVQNVGGQSSVARQIAVAGDANPRHQEDELGAHSWGDGGGSALDTNLYRASANILKTDDRFVAVGGVDTRVVATASLPAAGASMDGHVLIEDAGAGDRNLILYAGGQRFRIDGGAAF
jgi:hypothetical protein